MAEGSVGSATIQTSRSKCEDFSSNYACAFRFGLHQAGSGMFSAGTHRNNERKYYRKRYDPDEFFDSMFVFSLQKVADVNDEEFFTILGVEH